jgi:hypothetical protein
MSSKPGSHFFSVRCLFLYKMPVFPEFNHTQACISPQRLLSSSLRLSSYRNRAPQRLKPTLLSSPLRLLSYRNRALSSSSLHFSRRPSVSHRTVIEHPSYSSLHFSRRPSVSHRTAIEHLSCLKFIPLLLFSRVLGFDTSAAKRHCEP